MNNAPDGDLVARERAAMNPSKILVRGVNWLGDAVMTTPALLRLREAHRDAHIAILTDVKLADLWRNHPAVNSVLSFTKGESAWSISGRLRREGFHIGLVLPNSFRSALELWLAGIPRRLGYARPWRRLFFTDAISTRPGASTMRKRASSEIHRLIDSKGARASESAHGSSHQIFDYLHLVGHLGAVASPLSPFLAVTEDDVKSVHERWQIPRVSTRPLFGLNPGAEYGPAKRWPKERFIAAAVEIQNRTNCRWLLVGGKSDVPLANEIEAQVTSVRSREKLDERSSNDLAILNLAGATTLRELCALLKICRLLLTNDTGPAHVAAAVGTPVIIPFGSTSPELTGPGMPGDQGNHFLRSDAACSPCFLRECPIDFRCMTHISVKEVVETVLKTSHRD